MYKNEEFVRAISGALHVCLALVACVHKNNMAYGVQPTELEMHNRGYLDPASPSPLGLRRRTPLPTPTYTLIPIRMQSYALVVKALWIFYSHLVSK